MKIIFDNIVFSLQKAGGISVVWKYLLENVMTVSDIDYQCIEYEGAENNLFRKTIKIPESKLKILSHKLLSLKRYFSPKIGCNSSFIFHSSYYRYCKNTSAVNFTTVHDFTYEYYSKGIKKWLHCFQKHKAIKKSDYIICISETTKKDLFMFLPEIDRSKVHVVYNGVSDNYYLVKTVENSKFGDYVIFVGAREGYKNFKLAVETLKETRFNLVIVGKELSNAEKKMLISQLGSSRFFELGRISNDELNKIYNNAFCLLYPSLYEGFGIPVLEAQKAGCPVVTLNAPSIVEIIGDKTLVAKDKHSINEKLLMLEDNEFRQKTIQLGLQNVKKYSWEKMQQEMTMLYQKASYAK